MEFRGPSLLEQIEQNGHQVVTSERLSLSSIEKQRLERLLIRSACSQGSQLCEFIPKVADRTKCDEFFVAAKKLNFAGAEQLCLAVRKDDHLIEGGCYEAVQAWQDFVEGYENPDWQVTWQGKGYHIGQVVMPNQRPSNNCPVFFCDDNKLRCARTIPIFSHTVASGFGKIPGKAQLIIGGDESWRPLGSQAIPEYVDQALNGRQMSALETILRFHLGRALNARHQ